MARESRGEKARRQILDLNISGLTDAEIARNLGVNRSTVGRWRKGQTSPRKGGKGGNLTRLWKRTDKALGEGGRVNLSSFFRRVWVLKGEAQLPLTLGTPPTYSWPPTAAVWITAYFSDWVLSNGQNWNDVDTEKSLKVDLALGENGAAGLESALLEAMAKLVTSKGDDFRVEYVEMRDVILKRGMN